MGTDEGERHVHATDVYGATERYRAELWVRSVSPAGIERAHRDAIAELAALVGDGHVDDYSVRRWKREVGLSTTAARGDRAQVALDRVAAFRSWAEAHDRSLSASFGTREATSSVTGETYTAQRLPLRALAEYRGDDLVFVAPSTDGGGTTTVADRLATLAEGDRTARPATAPDGGRSAGTGDPGSGSGGD